MMKTEKRIQTKVKRFRMKLWIQRLKSWLHNYSKKCAEASPPKR